MWPSFIAVLSLTNASKELCVLAWLISEVLWHGRATYRPARTAAGWGIWLHHLQRKWHQGHYCLRATEAAPRSASGSCNRSGGIYSHLLHSFIHDCVSMSLSDALLNFIFIFSHLWAARLYHTALREVTVPTGAWCHPITHSLPAPCSISSTRLHSAWVRKRDLNTCRIVFIM